MRASRFVRAVLVVAAVGAVVVSTAAARAPAHTAGLVWPDCGGGYQCSTLDVPPDYHHPNGQTFKLAIIRLPAQDQAHPIAPLFVNCAGPGGTAGATIHAIGGGPSGAVNYRCDVVAVDPRGAAETQP